MSKQKQPIFDEWNEVQECNECTNYWNESCDGTPVGSERHCTAFKAVRSTDIPLRLKRAENAIKGLILCNICLITHLILNILFKYWGLS